MNFEKGFIKDEKLLFETSKVSDLLDLTDEVKNFSDKLDKINSNSIMGFIGNFGEGKSTLINNVKIYREGIKKQNNYWIEFDAWKYPDRKNLWEGFILDFAKQVDDETFEKSRKSIDGETNYDKETLMKTIGGALGVFIPGGSIVGNLSHFFRTSPAKRVFEIQEILVGLINKIESNKIFIIIEDIDRSGDNGIFFLETLKQFLNNNTFSKQIVVIVPIGTLEYEKNIDSYLKPIDYFDFFQVREPLLDKFIKELFIDEITQQKNLLGPLKDFLEGLFKYYPGKINLRKLKLILRKANQNHIIMHGKFDSRLTLDWRLNIIFETSKYIKETGSIINIFDEMKENKKVITNSLFGAYIYNLYSFPDWSKNRFYIGNNNSLFVNEYIQSKGQEVEKLKISHLNIDIINEGITKNSIVGGWFEHGSELKKFVISNIYLGY